jgi:hypothetical protein
MSETTAAPEAQGTTAPVEAAAVETQTTAVETAAPETAAPVADDYSWVPPKFLIDGKPDAKALAKSYQALEKKLGSKVANLAPEDVAEYDYKPTKFEFDEEGVSAFKSKAKELGLSTTQYQALLGEYETSMANVMPSVEKSEAALKEAWGSEFNSNLSAARRAFDEFAPSDLSMDDPALNSPAVLKLLARIGADLGEDRSPASASGANSGMTRAEAEALMATPAYWEDPAVHARVTAWFAKNVK